MVEQLSTPLDLGILLGLAYQSFVDELRADLAGRGFDDLGKAYGYVFRALGAGALNLSVDGRTTQSLIMLLAGRLDHQLDDRTTLIASVGAGYDALTRQAAITATFAGAPGASFVTHGIDPSPWLARGGLGLGYRT